jgi:hypothetical protein
MKPRTAEPVSAVLLRVVRGLDIESKLLAHAVVPAWPRAAGPRLAPHTRAAKLRDGVLTVEARSAAWLNEVSLMRDTLRARLNEELKAAQVREIRFRLGGAFPPASQPTAPPVATAEEIESAERKLGPPGSVGASLAARAWVLRPQKKR